MAYTEPKIANGDHEHVVESEKLDSVVPGDKPHGDRFNAGAILSGNAGHNTPQGPYEKKAYLINQEIDRFGFGRYQVCIWFLCGFGYFLDLLFAQALGLVAVPIYQEMNVVSNTGLIFTCSSVGLTVGALTFGLGVDIIGRRWAFNLSCLITAIFGTLIAAPVNNYNGVCAIAALLGFGLGGNIPIDATIVLETLPQNRRFLLALLSMWQPIGVVISSVIAYGLVPKYRCATGLPACSTVASGVGCCTVSSNFGWRAFMIVLGGISLILFFCRFFLFTFHESPKYLLGRGKEAEAIEVLHRIAKFNRAPAPLLTMEHFAEIDAETSQLSEPVSAAPLNTVATTKKVTSEALASFKRLQTLFNTKLSAFTFAILTIAYIGDFFSFNLAGSFLPIILAQNNVSSGKNTVTDTYRQYVYIKLPGVLGTIAAMLMVQLPLFGRKWSLVFGAIIQGISMAMYTQVKTTAGYVGLNALEYVAQSFFNAILYATTPELFPAPVRGSACGMLSTLGRLSGIVAPFAGQHFLITGSAGILWLAAGGIFVSAFVLIFLPVETRKRQSY